MSHPTRIYILAVKKLKKLTDVLSCSGSQIGHLTRLGFELIRSHTVLISRDETEECSCDSELENHCVLGRSQKHSFRSGGCLEPGSSLTNVFLPLGEIEASME